MFGVDLVALHTSGIGYDSAKNLPLVVLRCVEFLRQGKRTLEQGIFRLAGNNVRIQELRERADAGALHGHPDAHCHFLNV